MHLYKFAEICYTYLMRKISLKAYAKINITFDVLSKDEETGLHQVDTLMQTIDMADYVTVTRRRDSQCFSTVAGGVVQDTNALKAAQLFVEKFDVKGVNIDIVKRIPVGGGLGGSAADAAATLRAMAVLYDIPFADVEPLCLELGADVKFLFNGGLARCTGIGNEIEDLEPLPPYAVLVATPSGAGINTQECYATFDKFKKPFSVKTDNILNCLRNYTNTTLFSNNCLFASACNLNKKVQDTQKFLASDKAITHVAMTGSGSSCFALYQDPDKAFLRVDAPHDGYNLGVYKLVNRY